MAHKSFYVIKNDLQRYLDGTPRDYAFWSNSSAARQFKSIAEIRSFMTRMLKHPGSIDVKSWQIEQHDIAEPYPVTDIFTSSHTMALLKHQN